MVPKNRGYFQQNKHIYNVNSATKFWGLKYDDVRHVILSTGKVKIKVKVKKSFHRSGQALRATGA
jgi:hypothetical protein